MILDAASTLFVEEGYERVTMRRVAEKIEYSPTTIYLHFKDKQELFDAVCEETFSQLTARLERRSTASNAPLADLRDGLRAFIEFGTRHPAHYTVTFLHPGRAGDNTTFGGSIAARALDWVRKGVADCVAHEDIRTASVDTTAQALWAAIHGLTAMIITGQGSPFVAQKPLTDHLLDVLIDGLRTPAPERQPVQTQEEAPPKPRPAPARKPYSFMD